MRIKSARKLGYELNGEVDEAKRVFGAKSGVAGTSLLLFSPSDHLRKFVGIAYRMKQMIINCYSP